MKVPFLSFDYVNKIAKSEILKAFEDFFDSNWYILGDRVKEFEKEYAAFNQVSNCVGVSNGLDALYIALKVLDVGPGDEVIVPSNTYIATALAVSYVGATPVLVEPDKDTYNLDPSNLESHISSKTKAIMPVHLYGQSCEMKPIMELADQHGLFVIEDNAQSQGASYNERLTGSWGQINGTSFYPGKNLGALGDAGAITTNDESFAYKASVLRNYGSQKKYYNEVIGHNMRLDECQAAILSVRLKYLKDATDDRQRIAREYLQRLKNIDEIILPKTAEGATHVYHLFVIRTPKRDVLQSYLQHYEIGTLIHYPIPVHLQQAYAHLDKKKGDYPIAEEIADTCLSLPMWPGMKNEEISFVCDKIASFFTK